MVLYQKSMKESISKIERSCEENYPAVRRLRIRRLTKYYAAVNIGHAERTTETHQNYGTRVEITEAKDIDVLLELFSIRRVS